MKNFEVHCHKHTYSMYSKYIYIIGSSDSSVFFVSALRKKLLASKEEKNPNTRFPLTQVETRPDSCWPQKEFNNLPLENCLPHHQFQLAVVYKTLRTTYHFLNSSTFFYHLWCLHAHRYGKEIRLYLSWIKIHISKVRAWKSKDKSFYIDKSSFPRGKKCTKSICHCFISQLLRMKLQTAEINVSFAIDINEPKMSSSVFYYTQKPDVRIGTALWSTLQRNSIHQSEDNHAITQSLVPFTSMVRFILVFFSPYYQVSVEAGKNLSHICQQYSFTTINAMVKLQV